jgi:G3E family GTPase
MTGSIPISGPCDRPTAERLPVTIITGFLGSGKTTLLNHILTNQEGLRVAVIVNELGEIAIDNDLVIASESGMIELSNGCICSSLNNDLVDGVVRVLHHPERIEYLVVETTGIADPVPVALTFLRSEFKDLVRLDSIIAIADAKNLSLELFESEAAKNQLRYGDIILLNKCDLVGADRLSELEARIGSLGAGRPIIRTTRAEVPLSLILSVGRFQSDRYFARPEALGRDRHDHHGHEAAEGFSAVSFERRSPFALEKFQRFLNEEIPSNVFRGKGLIWVHETDRQYIFHLVGRRFSIDENRDPRSRRNRLVLIGRDLDAARLRRQLGRCLA